MPILYSNSAKYELLQLTDFAGYIVRRRFYQKSLGKFNFNKLYEMISTKFDRSPSGKVEGWGIKKDFIGILYTIK